MKQKNNRLKINFSRGYKRKEDFIDIYVVPNKKLKTDIVNKINNTTHSKLHKIRKEVRKSVLVYSLNNVAKKYTELFKEMHDNENGK